MEDPNLYLKDVLTERPQTRVPSADTVLRGIEELATENISYTAEKTGNVYAMAANFYQYIVSLPLHVPFRGGSNGQGQELPVPIHRRAGQVD